MSEKNSSFFDFLHFNSNNDDNNNNVLTPSLITLSFKDQVGK